MHGIEEPHPLRPERAFLAFAASYFVFQQFPGVLLSDHGEAAVDTVTPFLVVAASVATLMAFGLPRRPTLLAVLAGVLYVHAHGAHLAANSIHNDGAEGSVVYFWDERFSHIEGLIGWIGLVACFALAEREAPPRPMSTAVLAIAAVLLGITFFTGTVEGQTWWLELPAAAAFGVWLQRDPRPLLRAGAGALLLAALMIGVWAAIHGGVPEFSDL